MSADMGKYLLVKGKAGLGNRTLVVLDSMLYASITGRQLLIDWREGSYAPAGENAFGLLFDTPEVGDLQVLEGCDSVWPEVWRGALGLSVDQLFAQHFPDNEEMDTVPRVAARFTVNTRQNVEKTVAVRWGWTYDLRALRGRFSGELARLRAMSDEEILRWLLASRVRPVQEVRERVAAFRAARFGDKTIGVHVRQSDRKDGYGACFKHVQAYLREYPGAVVFLATDNQAVEEDFRGRFARVVVTEKWFPPAGVPIHRNSLPGRRPLENALEALVELYLLGECDALVYGSTSTFSVLANLISKAPREWRIDAKPLSIKPFLRKVRSLTRAMGLA